MAKIGRNSACPCGSGSKYKKCCFERLTGREVRYKNKIKDRYPNGDIRLTRSDEIKVSEVVLEYAGVLIDDANTAEGQDAAIAIAIAAWNLSLFDEETRKQKLLELPAIIVKTETHTDVHEKIAALLQSLIDKKHKEYPNINRFIIDHELIRTRDGFDLNITSRDFTDN